MGLREDGQCPARLKQEGEPRPKPGGKGVEITVVRLCEMGCRYDGERKNVSGTTPDLALFSTTAVKFVDEAKNNCPGKRIIVVKGKPR